LAAVRITRGQLIGGHEAVALRDALRRLRGRPFSADEVAWRLGMGEEASAALIGPLAAAGLVEAAEAQGAGPWYKLTLAGNALAGATARRPVSRAVARRHLEGLVARAESANASPDYLVWVERKGAGRFQRRPGPTEVGYAGLLQPIADAAKLMSKQLIVPAGVDAALFRAAPLLMMSPGFSPPIPLNGPPYAAARP